MTEVLQTDLNNIENVVLAGAGVAGIAYVGAINALHDNGRLNKVKRFAGTSSGSIVALGAALGYRGDELKTIVEEQDFSKFTEITAKDRSEVFLNLKRRGAYSGEELKNWLRVAIAQRLGDPNLTFAAMSVMRTMAEKGGDECDEYFAARFADAQAKLKKPPAYYGKNFEYSFKSPEELIKNAKMLSDLFVVAAKVDVNDKNLDQCFTQQIFSLTATPTMKIAQAVRASASYPYFFRNTTTKIDGEIHHYTDGGLINPLPTELFDKDGIPNPRTLALDVVPSKTKEGETPLVDRSKDDSFTIKALKELITRYFGKKTIETIRNRFTKLGEIAFADPHKTSRTVLIPKDNVEAIDFSLTKRAQNWLYNSGYQTMLAEIEKQPTKFLSPLDKILSAVKDAATDIRTR